jgi:2-methylcitrate dehydratase PrpD
MRPSSTGIGSHVFDFDDTDLTTAVHPSAAVLPVLLALAKQRGMSGRDFVTAMVLRFERNAASPAPCSLSSAPS